MIVKNFNNLIEFYQFLSENKSKFENNTSLVNFIKAMRFLQNGGTDCGCATGYVEVAEDVYKKLLEIMSDQNKATLKELLKVDQVNFFLRNQFLYFL